MIAAACILMSHIFMQQKHLPVQELQQNWFEQIDENLTLEPIIKAKNEIKKIYAKELQFKSVKSFLTESTKVSSAYSTTLY